MKVLRNSSWTRAGALFAVVAILSGVLMSHAAVAQKEKAVKGFPTVGQRDITLWSDGTRLSGVLLYPKDREEGEKLSAIVLCNGWGGTKASLMRSGIAPRFAAAGYNVYTDPKLLDVAGALERLPALPIGVIASNNQGRPYDTPHRETVPRTHVAS